MKNLLIFSLTVFCFSVTLNAQDVLKNRINLTVGSTDEGIAPINFGYQYAQTIAESYYNSLSLVGRIGFTGSYMEQDATGIEFQEFPFAVGTTIFVHKTSLTLLAGNVIDTELKQQIGRFKIGAGYQNLKVNTHGFRAYHNWLEEGQLKATAELVIAGGVREGYGCYDYSEGQMFSVSFTRATPINAPFQNNGTWFLGFNYYFGVN